MKSEQLDQIDDIMFNLLETDVQAELFKLTPEALAYLKDQCQQFSARLTRIAEQLAQQPVGMPIEGRSNET